MKWQTRTNYTEVRPRTCSGTTSPNKPKKEMMNSKCSKRPPQNRHGHSPNDFFEKAALPHTTGGAAAPTASEGGNCLEATLTKTFKETESYSKISRTAASEETENCYKFSARSCTVSHATCIPIPSSCHVNIAERKLFEKYCNVSIVKQLHALGIQDIAQRVACQKLPLAGRISHFICNWEMHGC